MHKNKPATILLVLLLPLLLQACTSTSHLNEQKPPEHLLRFDSLFGARPVLPTPDALFRLTRQQQAELDAFMARDSRLGRHEQLFQYLEGITRDFEYEAETLPASEVLRLGRGNCLSLAILTTALARHVGIELGYQLVSDLPVYEFNGSVVTKGVHVRSRLYDPDWEVPVGEHYLTRPGLTIDYFPTGHERYIGNVLESEFVAMYYRNIAADALQRDALNEAYWYAQEALVHDARNADALNLLAVTARRAGGGDYAERLYLYGIERTQQNLSLLKNYHFLLLDQDREQEARGVAQQIERLDDPSPFRWYLLAQELLEAGKLAEAIRYYEKALSLAPYLHEAHFGKALAKYHSGNLSGARRDLLSAIDSVTRASARRNYKAKLLSLEHAIAGG